ncbi:MFS transporter [Streptomyces xiamenensis]|uniref:MFS transporter n=1 Tax=Streptomyces xiamenensis TaxID=408015 RepID=UPI0035DF26B7
MTPSAPPDAAPVTTETGWRIALAAVLAATFMGQVDGFVVTVAAPSVQQDLPATFGQIQLVGAVYVLAAAAGLITGGRLGDRFGRRRIFLWGVALFTVASLACGIAPNAETLIAARFVQGAAAALLIPQELALIRTMFDDDNRRARAISAYGAVVGLGTIAGIAGGGLLVHADVAGLGWRAVFLINIPIGLAILLAGRRTIPESASTATPGLDLAGAALTAVALPALLLPIVMGQEETSATWLWLSALIGVVAAAALALQQWRARDRASALFPPHVLMAPGMPTGLAAIGVFFAGNAGLFLVFTYYTQTGLGFAPLAAGMMFAPLSCGFALGSAVSDRLAARFGPRLPVAGCLFLAASLATQLLVVRAHEDVQPVLLGITIGVIGLAEGLVVSPLIAGIFAQVNADDAGAASGAAATIVQIGLAGGFATVGSLYRFVLGGTPGDTGTAQELSSHLGAYSAATVALVVGALTTSGLCALRLRAARLRAA